jgi:hypothetical protein
MVAYMLLQTWFAPVSLQLHSSRQVSVGGGALHGNWEFDEAGCLSVRFHCKNNDSKAKRAVFSRVSGTDVWEKTNGTPHYKCFLTPIIEA